MRLAFLGNYQAPWCTEVHLAASLEALGHEVVRIQEGEIRALDVPEQAQGCDLLFWVQTYSLAEQGGTREERLAMLDRLRDAGIPTVGLHLDRWFGLARAHQVHEEPFFRADWVFTADGDNDQAFTDAGVNHRWFRPGVYHAEVGLGAPREEFRAEVAFVGNWRANSYHREWRQRAHLIRFLQTTYRGRVRFFPELGQPAVRGTDLQDLYASVKVVVGDSCFADRSVRYCSDRPFESVGRGAFLLMPRIPWLTEELTDGEHIRYWTPGDFGQLRSLIDHYLDPAQDAERNRIRTAGMERVRGASTYVHRMWDVLETLEREGAFRKVAA